MNYTAILKEMISGFKADVEKYLSGGKSEYVYKKEYTEQWGNTDCNYLNRKRLCYGLFFNVCEVGEPQMENMIRELFEEEIISRENESFQGIGDNLELLTVLMKKYRRPGDQELFERSKNANFDCFCGYDPERSYNESYNPDPESYELFDCIYLAGDLNLTDYVCRLVDIFKEKKLDITGLMQLKHFAEFTGRKADKEQAIEGCFEYFAHSFDADDMERLQAYEDMICLLVSKGETDKAFSLLVEGTEVLKKFNGCAFYDSAYEIMQADKNAAHRVWSYVGKYAERELKQGIMAPICYTTVIKCTELADDITVRGLIDKSGKS